jgi:predicted nucleic acid-binding Zn ribbon protein
MPRYSYICQEHGVQTHSFAIGQAPDNLKCSVCGLVCSRDFSNTSFHLKGDGWFGKNVILREQMALKNKRLESKENQIKKDGFLPKLVPNVNGEEVGSWDEAKKLASSKNLDTSGYDTKIQEEKNR